MTPSLTRLWWWSKGIDIFSRICQQFVLPIQIRAININNCGINWSVRTQRVTTSWSLQVTPRTWYIVREGLGVRLGLGLGPGGGRNERQARAIFVGSRRSLRTRNSMYSWARPGVRLGDRRDQTSAQARFRASAVCGCEGIR